LEQVALIVIYSSGWGIIIALGLANKMFKGCKDGLLYFHYYNKGLITIMPVSRCLNQLLISSQFDIYGKAYYQTSLGAQG
jgi:hypothetical protein